MLDMSGFGRGERVVATAPAPPLAASVCCDDVEAVAAHYNCLAHTGEAYTSPRTHGLRCSDVNSRR